jgi:AcrR family transcriptional regulator
MTRTGVRNRGTREAGERTRERLIAAAVQTLKTEGFAGASARAIARTGDFNQALVFYYFGSVNDLLLAALDATSAERMARYRGAVTQVETLPELLRVATEIYREDLDEGHIAVLAEMMAASTTFPELRPEIAARIEPWIVFAREAIERQLDGSSLASLVPSDDAAFAIVALYLGIEMLAHLDNEGARAESLFASGERLAALLGPLIIGTR